MPPAPSPENAADGMGPTLDGPAGAPPVLASAQSPLDGIRATLILLGYLGGQFCAGMAVAIVAGIAAAVRGRNLNSFQQGSAPMQELIAPAAILGLLAGAAAMVGLSAVLVRGHLRNRNPTGAAWAPGSVKGNVLGLAAGSLTALGYVAVAALVSGFGQAPSSAGPIARMATTPGLTQAAWLVMALLLAPPIEELLFRGVFYGGCRRSLGPVWAATLTTFIFVMLHITEMIHFLPSFAGITALALVALGFRLRTTAVGPAVAVHFGYNAVLAVIAICSTPG